jgi:hypothetical protein
MSVCFRPDRSIYIPYTYFTRHFASITRFTLKGSVKPASWIRHFHTMAHIAELSIESRPPSSWPLDCIPGHTLDMIVDYVAQDAIESDFYDPSGTSFEQERIGYGLIPFSLDLKNMSLVNRAFRENVFRREFMELVILDSFDRVKTGMASIREESFTYIR